MTTDDLVAFGGTAVLILPMIYFATGQRREKTLQWMRSDTRGAKTYRSFFGEPGPQELPCLPKNPRAAKKYWITIGVVAVITLACLSLLILEHDLPWARSLGAHRCVNLIFAISGTILLFLAPFKRSNYWPNALTKELIESLYRPQIERLREIATHWRHYAEDCEQRGAQPETDLALFCIPSVFSAGVATGAPNEWAVVGSSPKILEKSYFLTRKPQMSDIMLLPGRVKLSDYSRKNAVIYSCTLIDDAGERREFELCLNLKMVIGQIQTSPPKPAL